MKNKLKLALLLTSIVSSSSAFANATEYGAYGPYIQAAEAPLGKAMEEAKKAFFETSGTVLSAEINLLGSDTTGNLYFETVKVTKGYFVKLTFLGSGARTGVGGKMTKTDIQETAIPEQLHGRSIILVPIFKEGDASISSFNCLTDIDENIKTFSDQNNADGGYPSLVRKSVGDSSILRTCIYLKNEDLPSGTDLDSPAAYTPPSAS